MSEQKTAPKIALVTGGNAGIGYETCKGLLKQGYHVIVCARSVEKGEKAVATLLEASPEGSTAEALVLDLASLKSVRAAAESFLGTKRPLNLCVLNAGIMALPWAKTEDGFEQQWQVNLLGHFLFFRLLLPAILVAEEPAGRVVHLTSSAHQSAGDGIDYGQLAEEHKSDAGFQKWAAYGRSKLGNVLVSHELARRLKAAGSAVTSNAVHPGPVATGLLTAAGIPLSVGVSVEEGARTSIYVATSKELEGHSGGYYYGCKPITKIRTPEMGDLSFAESNLLISKTTTSEKEASAIWAEASKQLGLGEDLK